MSAPICGSEHPEQPGRGACILPSGHALAHLSASGWAWSGLSGLAAEGDVHPEAPAPVVVGVMDEARRLLALLDDAVESRDVQVELLALSLDRAYQTGRADALLAREAK